MANAKRIFNGAAMLAICSMLAKLIGAFYRIPLTNILGSEGIGIYHTVFPLYTVLVTIASGGIPIAIARLIATKQSKKDINKIFGVALVSLIIIGGAASVFVMAISKVFATMQGNSDSYIAYIAIAPAVFFVAFISVYRGYYQGIQNLLPTSLSQVVEQIVKVATGISLSMFLLQYGVIYGVLGGLAAISLSELASLLLLVIMRWIPSKKHKHVKSDTVNKESADTQTNNDANINQDTDNNNMQDVIDNKIDAIDNDRGISVAHDNRTTAHDIDNKETHNTADSKGSTVDSNSNTTVARDNSKDNNAISDITTNKSHKRRRRAYAESAIDMDISEISRGKDIDAQSSTSKLTIQNILKEIYRVAIPVTIGALILPLSQVIDSIVVIKFLMSTGLSSKLATSQFGVINGPVSSLINMPVVITMALAIALMPKIAKSKKLDDNTRVDISHNFRFAYVFAVFITIMLFVFAREIMTLLYSKGLKADEMQQGIMLLQISSVMVVYICSLQISTAVLQGINHTILPTIFLLVGAVFKCIVGYTLMIWFGIYGIVVATVVFYMIAAILGVACVKKNNIQVGSAGFAIKLIIIGLATTAIGIAIERVAHSHLSTFWTLAVCGSLLALMFVGLMIVSRAYGIGDVKGLLGLSNKSKTAKTIKAAN